MSKRTQGHAKYAIRDYPWNTHRKRLSLRSNQCSWRWRWDGMHDCTKACWPCEVHTISSAKCNAWLRCGHTTDGSVKCMFTYITVIITGRWVQTLASSITLPTNYLRKFSKRKKKKKIADSELSDQYQSSDISDCHIFLPLLANTLKTRVKCELISNRVTLSHLDCSSAKQVDWGDSLSWWWFLIDAGLLILALSV